MNLHFVCDTSQFEELILVSKLYKLTGHQLPQNFDSKVTSSVSSNVPSSVGSLGVGLVQIEMIGILGCPCFLDEQNSFEVPTKLNA